MSADEIDERVAAELLAGGARQLPRNRRLRDDGERLDRLDVAALDEGFSGLTGLEVDGAERPHERGQRLHRRANDDRLAVRHAPLDPARTIRPAAAVELDLVVCLRAAHAREREAGAD